MFYRPAASAMNVELGQRAAAFDNVTYLLHNRIEGVFAGTRGFAASTCALSFGLQAARGIGKGLRDRVRKRRMRRHGQLLIGWCNRG